MSAIAIFSGTFCQKGQIVKKIIDKTGFSLLSDQDLAIQASRMSGMTEKKVSRALSDKISVFNAFTHEKEQTLAYLKLALAKILSEKDDIIIDGFAGLLVPQAVSHVLRICLIADMKYRLSRASDREKLNEKDALMLIRKDDTLRSYWVQSLFKIRDPWDPSLYDMVIPTDKTPLDDIVTMISENLKSEVILATEASKKTAADFLLATNVEVLLAKEGHFAEVSARDGAITLTINKNVLMLGRLEEELKKIVGRVSGVKTVDTRIGKGFYQADVYRKYNFEMPSKVLLVDDEREFVQTLSERLLIRNIGSAVAYDGESALNMMEEDEPDVMILDLKMPGIDGIEVLRKVKESRPNIEVIILTGHGSEEDRKTCMELGAFAYLQKPVDIDQLSETLKKAKAKIKKSLE